MRTSTRLFIYGFLAAFMLSVSVGLLSETTNSMTAVRVPISGEPVATTRTNTASQVVAGINSFATNVFAYTVLPAGISTNITGSGGIVATTTSGSTDLSGTNLVDRAGSRAMLAPFNFGGIAPTNAADGSVPSGLMTVGQFNETNANTIALSVSTNDSSYLLAITNATVTGPLYVTRSGRNISLTWSNDSGFVTMTVTNGLASIGYVDSATNNYLPRFLAFFDTAIKAIVTGPDSGNGNAVAFGPGDLAFGSGSIASNAIGGAFAMGKVSLATGDSSVALGEAAVATNSQAFALGSAAVAGGVSSVAIGSGASALHDRSTVINSGDETPLQSTGQNQFWGGATNGFYFVGDTFTNQFLPDGRVTVATATDPLHAVNLTQLNTAIGGATNTIAAGSLTGTAADTVYPNAVLLNGSRAMTGNLNLGGASPTNAANATVPTGLPTMAQMNSTNALYLPLAGGTMTGSETLASGATLTQTNGAIKVTGQTSADGMVIANTSVMGSGGGLGADAGWFHIAGTNDGTRCALSQNSAGRAFANSFNTQFDIRFKNTNVMSFSNNQSTAVGKVSASTGFQYNLVNGFTGVITNMVDASHTNYIAYAGGIVTNNVTAP